jgi:hypothetical protein
VARRSSTLPERIRLLLDQGFPKPPGFEPTDVDRHLEWIHLWDWRQDLSERSTPDWVLYCEAAFGMFNAIVTRDFTQAEQAEEMVCLSRLRDFHVISWRQRVDDPISEWGQLLAYLPSIRRYVGEHDSRVILLPAPTLANDRNVHRPREFVGRIANSRGQSVQQVRREAMGAMRDWEDAVEGEPGKYTDRLRAARRGS